MSEHAARSGAAADPAIDPATDYGAEYYKSGCGPIPYERNSHWLNFFGGIAAELVRSLRPKRVFDAGCAWGFLVEALRDLGVDAYGVDISPYAIANVRPDMRPYCRVASLTEPIPGTYDLVACIEVLEHMPEAQARQALTWMTRVTDTILFSSTPSDFEEPTHINVHPPIYWLKLFAEYSFTPDLVFDASFVSPQAFLARRRSEPVREDVLLLFSETLRNRIYKVAFVNRQTQLEELEREKKSFESRIGDSEAQVEFWKAKSSQADETIRLLASECRSARHNSARILEQLSEARSRADEAGRKLRELELALEQEPRQQAALAAALAHLQTELQTVYTSPGWRLIRKYREWFHDRYWRHAWFRKSFEPAARWAIRSMHLTGPAEVSAVAVARTTELPAPPAPRDGRDDLASVLAVSANAGYSRWILENEPGEARLQMQRRMSTCFSYRPVISVIVPVYKVPERVFHEMIESVTSQTYERWELCLVHADPDNQAQREYLVSLAAQDPRIRLKLLSANKGISENSNAALSLATGEFLALLDHDDTLAPFALFEAVQALNEDRSLDFIYSDKDQLTEQGERVSPLFKPQWSPDILLNTNYLTHLCVMRTAHVREIGGWRSQTDGAQDWDLFLRITSRYSNVRHIPKVLYHWRRISSSVAAGGLEAKPYAAQGQVRAVADFCRERGSPAQVTFRGGTGVSIAWPAPAARKITLFYLTSRPGSPLDAIKQSLENPEMSIEIKPVEVSDNGSLAERLNRAVGHSSGDILVFLDETVTPEGSEWLSQLTGPLADPAVGLVGSKLLDASTRLLRHCGLIFTAEGRLEYIYAGQPEHVHHLFGAAAWYRDWSAVSGACFATRRDTWLELGGLSPQSLYPRLDVQLCLDIGQSGKRILYNPLARALQSAPAILEQPLWTDERRAAQHIRSYFPECDPHFNPNLDCIRGEVRLKQSGAANSSAARTTGFSAESQALVRNFDFSAEHIERSKALCNRPGTGRLDRLTWFVPDFVNPFYGGIHTILRFADSFRRNHNVRSLFCMLAHGPAARFRRQIAAAFPELATASDIQVIDGYTRANELPPSDACISTLWTTAYAALHFQNTRRKFYFIQDDETLFYPAGSTSALVEATYGFGFTGICNTVTLRNRYVARGGDASYFTPCIDPSIFHKSGRKPPDGHKPYTLFCYGRPGHPRNCFELLSAALRRIKEHLGNDIVVLNAGAPWDLAAYGLQGIVENLGLLGYHSTAALYRMCDAGLVMMMTRHPSYLPVELMACGSLVITNRNPDTAWLLEDGENCLLADGSPTSLVERVEEGLRNVPLRRRITETASRVVEQHYSDWDQEIEKIYQYMRSCC